MQGFFEKLAEFLLPSRKTFSNKLFLVVGLGGLLLLIDNTIGVSYYYKTSRKVELISRLNEVISECNTDSAGKAYAVQIRDEVYGRKGVIGQAGSFLSPFRRYSIKVKTHQPNNAPVINTCNDSMNFHFIMSAAGIPFIFAIIGFIGVFFRKDVDNGFWERLSIAILMAFACVTFGIVLMALIGLIPRIYAKNCYPNIILNIIIQIVIIGLLIRLVNKTTKVKG